MCSDFREQELGGDFEAGIKLGNNSNSFYNIFLKDGPLTHYRFEQDESLTKSATHSENAIKSI